MKSDGETKNDVETMLGAIRKSIDADSGSAIGGTKKADEFFEKTAAILVKEKNSTCMARIVADEIVVDTAKARAWAIIARITNEARDIQRFRAVAYKIKKDKVHRAQSLIEVADITANKEDYEEAVRAVAALDKKTDVSKLLPKTTENDIVCRTKFAKKRE